MTGKIRAIPAALNHKVPCREPNIYIYYYGLEIHFVEYCALIELEFMGGPDQEYY